MRENPSNQGAEGLRALSVHFRADHVWETGGMLTRKHLRIVRAVEKVVAAAKELADAERALRRPRATRRKRAVRNDGIPEQAEGEGGDDGQG